MKKIWVLWLVVVIISGCGYRFAGGSALPNDVKKVFVNMFENRTEETGVESVLTNAVIYEFSRNGTLAGGQNRADARLWGTVVSITRGTVSRIGTHTSQERRVTLVVSLQLKDLAGEVLWSKRMSDNEEYLVVTDKETTERNRRVAIRGLSKRLAEKVYSRLTDNF